MNSSIGLYVHRIGEEGTGIGPTKPNTTQTVSNI
jgi:hypothetical protein